MVHGHFIRSHPNVQPRFLEGSFLVKKPNRLFLSASGITDFLSCPAKFAFRQAWRVKDQQDNLGLMVHRALEAGEIPEDKDAKKLWQQLKDMVRMYNIKIEGREVKEQFDISPEILFTRIFDVVGTQGKQPVIVDYKTATKPWEDIDGIFPQGKSIQAASYLMPPQPKGIQRKLIFLVASKYGRPQNFTYERNDADETNLFQAIHLIESAWKGELFPYNRTKMCAWCDYSGMCFKSCGWRNRYEKREDHADIAAKSD
jgi:CRISPR/Cas system-associated exonuclease Cas4 (RecB family)